MKGYRYQWLSALLVAIALFLGACVQGTQQIEPEEAAEGETEAEVEEEIEVEEDVADQEEPLKFAYVSPDPLGVNAFLIMGQSGIEAAGEQWGAETQVLESEDPTTRVENVRAAVNEGADIVMVLGFEFNDIIPQVAAEAPEVEFLIVDQCIEDPPPNVHCAVFREHEGAFLIGVAAASLSETNHVGAIGALDIPFLHRYTDGFAAGARYVNPDIEVDTLWVGGDNPFSDPARAKEQALAMAANGADQIFAATAAGNFGIFEAAEEQDFFAYGVDVNQCPTAPGHVVDNLLKRVDVVVVQAIDAIMEGTEESVFVYGLEEDGIGLVALDAEEPAESQCVIMEHPEVIERLAEVEQQIISGEIVVEDPMFAQ
ncbi:MAG: BMP family ABC transporter substrate-binding protein [Chloroflexota bacterium]|nr:BMP family ABC transporter substrate-binding protein [Chloroflexota bacterium]